MKEHSLQDLVYDEYDAVILILCYVLKLFCTFLFTKMLSIIYISKNICFGRSINVHVMNDVSNDTKDLADIDLVKYCEVTRV